MKTSNFSTNKNISFHPNIKKSESINEGNDFVQTQIKASITKSNAKSIKSKISIFESEIKKEEQAKMRLSMKASGYIKASYRLPKHIHGKWSDSEVKILRERLRKNDVICAIISCFGIFTCWLENEIFYNNNNTSNIGCHILRTSITMNCLILSYFIYKHYSLEFDILKSKKVIHATTTFLKSNVFKPFLFEVFISFIHCPPGLDINIPNKQLNKSFDISLDAYISAIILIRLYIFFRLFNHFSYWTNARAERVWPFKSENRRHNFDYIWNSFWCVMVTMTTIGYGDIYPVTHLGRLVIIVACICGSFILSLFVVTLKNITELSKGEEKAYEDIVKRNNVRKHLRVDAVKIIQTQYRIYKESKKSTTTADKKKKVLYKLDLAGINVFGETRPINTLIEDLQESCHLHFKKMFSALQPINIIENFIDQNKNFQETNDKILEGITRNSEKILDKIKLLSEESIAEKMMNNNENKEEEMPNFIN